MPLYLVPKQEGRPIVVDKAVLFVGRHPDCDVILTRSRKVSRKHCCLAQVDDRFFLRDLGSMNGVEVNGKRVKREAPVEIGDEIVIGDVPFTLQGDERRRKEAAKPATVPDSIPDDAPRSTPSRRESARPDPLPTDLSQDFPIPIPDEQASFRVESGGSANDPATLARKPNPEDAPSSSRGGDTLDDSQNDVAPLSPPPQIAYDDDDGSLPDM